MATIAVIGGGNGGFAFAGLLGYRGHDVRLFELPRFQDSVKTVAELGGVRLQGTVTGFGKVNTVTTDIKVALEGAEIVMVSVPAFGHREIAQICAPYLNSDQLVVLNPGAVFGAFEFRKTLKDEGNKEDITVAETSSNLFGCRKSGPADVNIIRIKHVMPTAAIPVDRTPQVVEKLKSLSPEFAEAGNILETSLGSGNTVLHPTPGILNAGWIETTKGAFDFYWEGMSPSVCRVMELVDSERIAVGKGLGVELPSILTSMTDFYGFTHTKDLHDMLSHSTAHGGLGIPGPKNLMDRYISEDVPTGLVPISEIGRALGVATPNIDALILLASSLTGIDFRGTGRNLEQLGLVGLERDALVERLING